MNFFKTVFSDEPNPADPSFAVDDQRFEEESNVRSPNPRPNLSATQTAWSFGGLIKTLASKSESVIETYRRDLEEFGSGLKKETAVIRDVTSRAVKVLPGSLEIGATVARESLESVGQAIDDFGTTVWKETADIISQGKETILAVDQDNDSSLADSSSGNSNNNNNNQQFSDRGLDLKRYSRFESQLNAIRVDENTYCEEPEDLDDYGNWKLGFVVDDESEEIGSLIDENEVMEGIYRKLVPSSIDYESFWSRYFYRVYKLKQAEDARAKLVNRVVAADEEEDMTWDFDDDEDEDDEGNKEKNELASNDEGNKEKNELASNDELPGNQSLMVNKDGGNGETSSHIENDGKIDSIKTENRVSHEVISEGKSDLSEEKTTKTEEKNDNGNSCKDSDFSFVSTQPSVPEEEDLGWDEIEDIGSSDENKMAVSGSIPNIPDLRKRLSAAEEDEDLNWDIEDDDDEPAKKS